MSSRAYLSDGTCVFNNNYSAGGKRTSGASDENPWQVFHSNSFQGEFATFTEAIAEADRIARSK